MKVIIYQIKDVQKTGYSFRSWDKNSNLFTPNLEAFQDVREEA